jgi:hypothetical protein
LKGKKRDGGASIFQIQHLTGCLIKIYIEEQKEKAPNKAPTLHTLNFHQRKKSNQISLGWWICLAPKSKKAV